jgi:hypothetical protein
VTSVERDWRGETIKKSFFFFSLSLPISLPSMRPRCSGAGCATCASGGTPCLNASRCARERENERRERRRKVEFRLFTVDEEKVRRARVQVFLHSPSPSSFFFVFFKRLWGTSPSTRRSWLDKL